MPPQSNHPSLARRTSAYVGVVLSVLVGCYDPPEAALTKPSEATVLHIALQDGFGGDLVVIRVDGAEVLRQADVRTDPRISLAYAFDAPTDGDRVAVEIALPEQNVAESIEVDLSQATHLGVSYRDGAIRFNVSKQPFGYV